MNGQRLDKDLKVSSKSIFVYNRFSENTERFELPVNAVRNSIKSHPDVNLKTNKVTPNGGLKERHASAMNMKPNLLAEFSLSDKAAAIVTRANDIITIIKAIQSDVSIALIPLIQLHRYSDCTPNSDQGYRIRG